MYVIIKNNNIKSCDISKYSSISRLKSYIQYKKNSYYIEYNGKILSDESKPLYYYGIKNNSVITIHKKNKGGIDGFHIFLIILCGFIVFIFIPLLLFSGLIPLILHIIECLMLNTFEYLVSLMVNLRRIKNILPIFKFIVKTIILLFKTVFLYYGLHTIFTLTYFSWTTIINGGGNLFVKTDKYCKEIQNMKLMSKISTIIFIVVYGLLRLPNIFVSSFGSIISLCNKHGLGKLILPINTLYVNLQTSVYENKWDGIFAIPTVGQILKVLFEVIDTAFMFMQIYTTRFANFGCKIKSLGNGNSIKNAFEEQLKNNKSQKLDTYDPSKLSNKVCCDKEFFKVLKKDIGTLILELDKTGAMTMLKDYGITKPLIKLVQDAFDTKLTEESLKNFKNSFFIFKLKDGNVEGIIGLFLRTILCNIMNISKYISDVLFQLGTPRDIGDTVKCGIFAGQASLLFYYFAIIYIIMSLTNFTTVVRIILSILIYLLSLCLKFFVPLSPLPLII
tara:strand:+ start:1024 stop:2535 length:1512 start_codon:yes stop_codon:yes gene_type:complete